MTIAVCTATGSREEAMAIARASAAAVIPASGLYTPVRDPLVSVILATGTALAARISVHALPVIGAPLVPEFLDKGCYRRGRLVFIVTN